MKIKGFMTVCVALAALFQITTLNAQNMEKENRVPKNLSAFPIGDENTQYAKFFRKRHHTLIKIRRFRTPQFRIRNIKFSYSSISGRNALLMIHDFHRHICVLSFRTYCCFNTNPGRTIA